MAPFYKGFVDIEFEERVSIFNPFYIILYIFCITAINLFVFVILKNSTVDLFFAQDFLWFFLLITSYFLLKKIAEFGLKLVLNLPDVVSYYLHTKSSYLYSISFYLFLGIILFTYTNASINWYLFFLIICLIIRYFTLFINNKNMIISYLFYFILYLCAFEIAPLFILYKLML